MIAHPRLILLCGLPGSGKTTLARRMERVWPVVRLCPDEWIADLGIDLWDDTFRDRLEHRMTALAHALLRLGQSVVLEYGVWNRAERDQHRAQAHALGVPIDLYYLEATVADLWRRLRARNRRATHGTVIIPRAVLERFVGLFQPPDAAELALFDRAAVVHDVRAFLL